MYPDNQVYSVVGKETHQDGGTHFHVFIAFERKINVKDARKAW